MTETRWTVGEWAGRNNYECAECKYATLSFGSIVRHYERKHEAEPPEPGGPLADVAFASDEAAELAHEGGLDSDIFDKFAPSGVTGFTVADVRGALEAVTEEE